jgi:exonuclease III
MPHIYKVATVNINGISLTTCIRMLETFIHKHEIDVILLQEVTQPDITTIQQYTTHTNVGTERRDTEILTRDGLIVT